MNLGRKVGKEYRKQHGHSEVHMYTGEFRKLKIP